jgi:uncharacterized protein YlxP (DUF503 family)
LTCAVVASDQRHVEQVLAAAGRFVAEHGLARVIDAETSFL